MALAKTTTDLIGSYSGGTVTYSSSIAGGATFVGTNGTDYVRRDVSGKVGIAFVFRVLYGASAPTTRPKLEIFTSLQDDDDMLDTEAYETVELPTTTNAAKQVTIPIRFAEDIHRIAWKITNGATNAITAYLGIVETSI